MPTPIIHLCVAKELIGKLEIDNIPAFCLGSISPDAIYLAPTYYDIEGKYEQHMQTHLANRDFENWDKNAKEFIIHHKEDENNNFYLGYFAHLVTDIYWRVNTFPTFEKFCSDNIDSWEERRKIYYNDAEHFDFEFFEKFNLKADIWDYLESAETFDVSDLLTAHEINSWKENTLRLFDNKEKINKPVIYFTYDIIMDLIANSVKNIVNYMKTAG